MEGRQRHSCGRNLTRKTVRLQSDTRHSASASFTAWGRRGGGGGGGGGRPPHQTEILAWTSLFSRLWALPWPKMVAACGQKRQKEKVENRSRKQERMCALAPPPLTNSASRLRRLSPYEGLPDLPTATFPEPCSWSAVPTTILSEGFSWNRNFVNVRIVNQYIHSQFFFCCMCYCTALLLACNYTYFLVRTTAK